jgi:tetratricopeptide (TPR) repeat protein
MAAGSKGASAANVRALCEQGLTLHRAGRIEEARACYKKALLRDPKSFDALHLLGIVCSDAGESQLAVVLMRRAIAVRSNDALVQSNLAKSLIDLKRLDEALASANRAIALDAGLADAHYNRGLALHMLQRPDEALASYDAAIALRADHAQSFANRGSALRDLDRPLDALASQDAAIALDPHSAEAHNNRGSALRDLGRPAEALASYETAVSLAPGDPEAHFNKGVALADLGRADEVLASCETALALRPDYAAAHYSRGMIRLQAGDFEAGWREYEWRRRLDPAAAFEDERLWLGAPDDIAGRRLFVRYEQGLGDTIQFCRYARLLRAAGAEVVMSVQDPLAPLLRGFEPGVEILGGDERPSHVDFQCPMLSLPLAFGTRLDSIPAWPRYIEADAGRRAAFEARLGPRTRPRVGLAWSGAAQHKNDLNRSIAFERLIPALSDAVEWHALQNEIRPKDQAAFSASGRVAFHGDALADFADTAALTDLMDLVVSVDTSLAHLAGALGKPVWILLPFNPDWRWLLRREDSPWYPSARLFRQTDAGDWDGVVSALARELSAI